MRMSFFLVSTIVFSSSVFAQDWTKVSEVLHADQLQIWKLQRNLLTSTESLDKVSVLDALDRLSVAKFELAAIQQNIDATGSIFKANMRSSQKAYVEGGPICKDDSECLREGISRLKYMAEDFERQTADSVHSSKTIEALTAERIALAVALTAISEQLSDLVKEKRIELLSVNPGESRVLYELRDIIQPLPFWQRNPLARASDVSVGYLSREVEIRYKDLHRQEIVTTEIRVGSVVKSLKEAESFLVSPVMDKSFLNAKRIRSVSPEAIRQVLLDGKMLNYKMKTVETGSVDSYDSGLVFVNMNRTIREKINP